uniref:Uncharacterized protein LOC116954811 isoform X1 n=2 Tax=Petromyzon marinus TaxID=7757 RepID=A0AAJ7XFP1_PETMA|nr:uncharacterized protein LOC116954811 isoform X1 [Petromyzon marinus]
MVMAKSPCVLLLLVLLLMSPGGPVGRLEQDFESDLLDNENNKNSHASLNTDDSPSLIRGKQGSPQIHLPAPSTGEEPAGLTLTRHTYDDNARETVFTPSHVSERSARRSVVVQKDILKSHAGDVDSPHGSELAGDGDDYSQVVMSAADAQSAMSSDWEPASGFPPAAVPPSGSQFRIVPMASPFDFPKQTNEVPVYFHLHSKESLPCGVSALEMTAEPEYLWLDQNDHQITGSTEMSVTSDGDLIFKTVTPRTAGVYTCVLKYTNADLNYAFHTKYMVYVYHPPYQTMYIHAKYRANACSSKDIVKREQWIRYELNSLLVSTNCIVQNPTWECYEIGKPEAVDWKLTVEYVAHFSFMVYPYGDGWNKYCTSDDSISCQTKTNTRLQKAYSLIQVFLKKQTNGAFSDQSLAPLLFYMKGSMQALRISHCKPGFGKNYTRYMCDQCCVVCDPGKFTSTANTFCHSCLIGSYNPHYGAAICIDCPQDYVTLKRGSTSPKDCVLPQSLRRLIGITVGATLGGVLLFAILFAIIVKCCCTEPHDIMALACMEKKMQKKIQALHEFIRNVDLVKAKRRLKPCPILTKQEESTEYDSEETSISYESDHSY